MVINYHVCRGLVCIYLTRLACSHSCPAQEFNFYVRRPWLKLNLSFNVLPLMSSVFCNIGDVELKNVACLLFHKFVCLRYCKDLPFYFFVVEGM